MSRQKCIKERVRDEVQMSMESSTKLIDEYVAIDQKPITILPNDETIRETIGAIPTVVFYSSIMRG